MRFAMSSPDPIRERLIHAAGEIFAERGFRGTTVREVCRRASANIAAVNYYFRDKQGLYVEAVKAAHCAPPERRLQFPQPLSTDQKLYLFVRGFLSQLLSTDRPVWHAQLMMRELAEPTDACVALVEEYLRPMAEVLESILREVVPPAMSRDQFFLYGFSVVSQCLFYKVQKPIAELLVGRELYSTYTVPRLADHIARFSCQAMQIPFRPELWPGLWEEELREPSVPDAPAAQTAPTPASLSALSLSALSLPGMANPAAPFHKESPT